jgi:outer membrane protein OmpA-like peptidoglycan-associated protein
MKQLYKVIILLDFFIFIFYANLFSQKWSSANSPNNDIENAIEIKDSIVGPTNVYKGYGKRIEYTESSFHKEENSAWYKFTIYKDTVITFDLIPRYPNDDYDFILYKCPAKDCIDKIKSNLVKPDRVCFSYNTSNYGATGMSELYKDDSIPTGPGLGYAAGIPVKQGDVIYLMVDFPYPFDESEGYTIFFHNLWHNRPKVLRKSKPLPKPIVLENVLFEYGKSILLKESYPALDTLVKQLQLYKTMKIEISGHTDSTGIETLNQILSEERAKMVVEYFISKNIDKSRLSYKGYGSKQPIASNDTEEGRKKNRRVEFIILKK